jgi:transcriptional regulator of acetoin/glycerol metabolism
LPALAIQQVLSLHVIGSTEPLQSELPGDGSEQAETVPAASTAPQPAKVLSAIELEELEKRNLLRALETCGWKISGTEGVSALMGLPPSTVSSRMKALGIRRL